jgi:hypothetical protein
MNEEEKKENVPPTKVNATWFFERTGDNHIFACDELEAWNLLNNKSNWARRDFKMLGMSDGRTYVEVLKSSNREKEKLMQERAMLDRDYQKYLQTEERLRFTELKDDTDEMVIKVKGLINDLGEKMRLIDDQVNDYNRITVKKAFDAELERARGNMVAPRNFDIMTPIQADRDKILANLKR